MLDDMFHGELYRKLHDMLHDDDDMLLLLYLGLVLLFMLRHMHPHYGVFRRVSVYVAQRVTCCLLTSV